MIWSPLKITKSGFSWSRSRPTNSNVLGSASHFSPLGVGGISSLQTPVPVLRCKSAACMILNLPFSLTLGIGLEWGAFFPRLMLSLASCPSPLFSRSSGVPAIRQPSLGSTASAPNSTSTEVMIWFEPFACRFAACFNHIPLGLPSHFSFASPFTPCAGSSRPTVTSKITWSSGNMSSSFLRLTCTYALFTQPLPKYRSFSIRCQTSASSLHVLNILRLEQDLIVISVTMRPGWCAGSALCSAEGRTR